MINSLLVIPDQHAHPDFNNDRADWLGQYIKESRPDVVVNIGDAADLASLSTYDKGKASFAARNYEADIEAHLDFQARLWEPMRRAKKRRPERYILEGNHEFRIKRALETQPELGGDKFGISFRDLDFDSYYDFVVEYVGDTPGVLALEGVNFAHFFISGIMGKPIGGLHHASSLLAKNSESSVCGHSHTADFATRTTVSGRKINGLVAGVFQDYHSPWAGNRNDLWWRGVVVLRNVENGNFDPEFISLDKLRREYGQ